MAVESSSTRSSSREVPVPDITEFMRFEEGEMEDDEAIDFFQRMIDSGAVWQLQGFYGRTARDLIQQGFCTDTHGVLNHGN